MESVTFFNLRKCYFFQKFIKYHYAEIHWLFAVVMFAYILDIASPDSIAKFRKIKVLKYLCKAVRLIASVSVSSVHPGVLKKLYRNR